MHKIHRLNSSASTVAPAAVPRFNDCWGCQSCSLVLTRCSITKSGQWIQLVRLGLEAGSTDRPTPRCPAPKRGQGGLHPPRQQWCRQRPLSAEDEGPCLNPGGGASSSETGDASPSTSARGAVNNGTLAGERRFGRSLPSVESRLPAYLSSRSLATANPPLQIRHTMADGAELRYIDAASPICRCSSCTRAPRSSEDLRGACQYGGHGHQLRACGRDCVLSSFPRRLLNGYMCGLI